MPGHPEVRQGRDEYFEINDDIKHITCTNSVFHCKIFTTTTKEFTTTLDPVFDGTGLLILGQEQDSFGGGFDKFQSFSGKISQFNVFQR